MATKRKNEWDKKKVGRKIFDGKNYEDVILKLEEAWALDCSDAEAAAFANISPPALCEFLKNNPKISERKQQLKQRPVLAARDTLVKAIKGDEGVPGNADLALKYLERKRKDEFSLLQKIETTDTVSINFIPAEKKTDA